MIGVLVTSNPRYKVLSDIFTVELLIYGSGIKKILRFEASDLNKNSKICGIGNYGLLKKAGAMSVINNLHTMSKHTS